MPYHLPAIARIHGLGTTKAEADAPDSGMSRSHAHMTLLEDEGRHLFPSNLHR